MLGVVEQATGLAKLLHKSGTLGRIKTRVTQAAFDLLDDVVKALLCFSHLVDVVERLSSSWIYLDDLALLLATGGIKMLLVQRLS